jgi:tetratricopeptide (TPR) repeat protein
MGYGAALFERGRYEESIVQFQAAADIRPHSDMYYDIGNAQAMLQRYDDARRSFERALSLNPTDPDILRSLRSLPGSLGR